MAEGSYEYECSRAELLGIAKPSYEEYLKNRAELETEEVKEEEQDAENSAEAEAQNEALRGVSGRLDELNQIIQGTQRKLSRFKTSYGSLTNILKIKLGRNSSQPETNDIPANDDAHSTNINIDKSDEKVNGSIGCDRDNDSITNQNPENSSGTPIDDLGTVPADKENIETTGEAEAKENGSQLKKILNFSFMNIGGSK